MTDAGGYLAVARLRKPHGLKGEVVVWTLTDDPESVLRVGGELVPIDDEGHPVGPAVAIERSRPYHREWLLKFEGVADRTSVEQWRERVFGVPAGDLAEPAADELYVHEIPGARVLVAGKEIGSATGLLDTPGGGLLAIDVGGREVLVPFRKPIVARVDRASRSIELDPPAGLLEL
jgi:16S rRNA processing protein RimM